MADLSDTLSGRHAVVLGGGGFLGSHLCERLLDAGASVTAIDNFITSEPENLEHLVGRSGFRIVRYDVTDYLHVSGQVDDILHFASPASPEDYLRWPIQTLKVGSLGTHKALGLAHAKGARFLLASTSEVYGDPQVNPQPESYWGNVNPVGPRGVYDEAKRFAEALTLAYHRQHGVDVRISRTFNSILADEQVLYDDGAELRREPVEVLAQRLGRQVELSGFSVPSFDRTGRVRAARATALVGHPTHARCYEVTTAYGRSIRVTGDHSLFVEGADGQPQARPVSALRIGDHIAVASRAAVPERDRPAVSIVDLWARANIDPWGLVVQSPGLGELVWRHRFEILPLLMAHLGASDRRSTWGAVHRMRGANELPLAVFQQLNLPLPVEAEANVRKARSKLRLKLRIPLTDELLWLLGLYVAEGCRFDKGVKSAFVNISGDQALLSRAAKVFERDLGVHVVHAPSSAERSAAIVVHSQLLLLLLDDLGFYQGPKRIPGWVLGLPLHRLKWFLEGYREGDGVHSGLKYATQELHEFSTVSEDLKDDLVVALSRFGLLASVGSYTTTFKQRTGDRRYPFWRISVHSVAPWSPLDWDRGVEQRITARRCGDLVWAAVKGIKEIESSARVYDFCVPGGENFWAGTGVMAHNTFGPKMRIDDGRAVPAFFAAALRNRPLPVYGDGLQTRSLCYVDDQVEGLLRLLVSDYVGPVNIGNPEEVTILELAQAVQVAVGNHPGIEYHPAPTDDPQVRRPDTTLAERVLGWKAEVSLEEGLHRTVGWFRSKLTT